MNQQLLPSFPGLGNLIPRQLDDSKIALSRGIQSGIFLNIQFSMETIFQLFYHTTKTLLLEIPSVYLCLVRI
jgi:hypothetical protein